MGTCLPPYSGSETGAHKRTRTGTGKTKAGAEKIVLFASTRPLEQAENIKPLYYAYDGLKGFAQLDPWRHHPDIHSGRYGLMVCDEFPTESPGKIIMVGHGFPGLKLSGLDQAHPYHSKKHAPLMDYVISTSQSTRELMARFCGVPVSSVLPLGAPRTDAYAGKRKGDGGTDFTGKHVYFYLPTWRAVEETPLPGIDWDWLDNQLADDELIAVRPHPMTNRILHGQYRHIREYPNTTPFTPYLVDCDVVITDYSASMIDGYLCGKPCVLFEKVKGYTETRGMYLDYPGQYCSRYATNEADLLSLIRKADGLTRVERDITEHIAGACDGHSTERIINLIKEEAQHGEDIDCNPDI